METPEFWAVAVIAALLVGLSKGGLPMLGSLAVPVMALTISPVVAAGLLLPVFVISDMFGLWAWRGSFSRRVLWIVIPGAIFGIGIGWATASYVPEAAVRLLIGVIGLVFAANALLRHASEGAPRKARVAPGLFWGTLTGFTSFVSHSGAPPWQVYTLPLRMEKTIFAGTSTIAFAIINAVKLVPYYALGQLGTGNLKLAMLLTIPAVIGVMLGVKLTRLLPEKLFFRIVIWALLAISLKLIFDATCALL